MWQLSRRKKFSETIHKIKLLTVFESSIQIRKRAYFDKLMVVKASYLSDHRLLVEM
jgi:hypothetical protein